MTIWPISHHGDENSSVRLSSCGVVFLWDLNAAFQLSSNYPSLFTPPNSYSFVVDSRPISPRLEVGNIDAVPFSVRSYHFSPLPPLSLDDAYMRLSSGFFSSCLTCLRSKTLQSCSTVLDYIWRLQTSRNGGSQITGVQIPATKLRCTKTS